MARFYYRPGHPKASERGFVAADELDTSESEPSSFAINSGIMAGRFYENVGGPGVVVNSRRQHKEWMKQNNTTHMSDFKGVWAKAAKEREEHRKGGTQADRRERREALASAIHGDRQ